MEGIAQATLPATWDDIKRSAGNSGTIALSKVWYLDEELTSQENTALRQLFDQYPLRQKDYTVWLKQTLRQVYENDYATRNGLQK